MILLNNNVCPSVPSDQIQTTISFPWLFPFIGSISAGSSAQCNVKNYCAFAFWSGIAGLLDPNLLDHRTAIVEQFTLDLGVYWKLANTSFQSTKGWANSVILSSSFVSIFVGISRFVPHPHAIRSSRGRSGVLPTHPFILSLISTWEIFTTCFALSLKHADGIIHTPKPRSLTHA